MHAMNTEQRAVVEGLHHNIECISGPPGTGKSTTIYHIIEQRVPAGELVLVCAVRNKAIEAVANNVSIHFTTGAGPIIRNSENKKL